ncbi:expressed unknown protein [Seminavis robusta]|uniref:Uncharacterized protein n=1 Tax=Seminavis robusta TaxID=568900 RepID=A0A9N8EX36_9STRA|nr:expressed unknown protein [Seminavis robusta]|eukprot:Sro2335_g323800.1 n/a (107) ;mRNA; r:4617-5195
MLEALTQIQIGGKQSLLCHNFVFRQTKQAETNLKSRNPKKTLDRAGWLKEASKKEGPTFENFEEGDNELQFKRKGKHKVGLMSVSVIQTMELTSDGKVKSLTVVKA